MELVGKNLFDRGKIQVLPVMPEIKHQICPTCKKRIKHGELFLYYDGETHCSKECLIGYLVSKGKAEWWKID